MTSIYIYAFASVLIVSIVSFIGVFALSLQETLLKKYISLLVSVAIGALLGDAFIHLIPEALAETSSELGVSLAIIGGILVFFILEKFFHWHHHGDDVNETHIHPSGRMILVSDSLHNFIDGLIIASSYMVGIEIGIATTIAVVLHEIPQEIGDFGVLIHSGYTKTKALLLNFISALTAVLGVAAGFVLGGAAESLAVWFLPIAAGGFIYIASADLIPELHKTKDAKHSALQLFAVCIGVAAMVALVLLEA